MTEPLHPPIDMKALFAMPVEAAPKKKQKRPEDVVVDACRRRAKAQGIDLEIRRIDRRIYMGTPGEPDAIACLEGRVFRPEFKAPKTGRVLDTQTKWWRRHAHHQPVALIDSVGGWDEAVRRCRAGTLAAGVYDGIQGVTDLRRWPDAVRGLK